MHTIYFDMDGTIADFYGVDGWLNSILAEDIQPYVTAESLVSVEEFEDIIIKLQSGGYKVGAIR